MYKTIMVPTDGSGFDREAIRVALRLAERREAKIRLVRVLATGSFFGMAAASEGTSVAADVVMGERDAALSELYALAAECRANTTADVTIDLHTGPVADVLEGYAKRHEVDLIVISTHGRSGVARLSLGSVTDSLIRHTSIPVLVVKPPASYLNPQVGDSFRQILVPLDGSTLAEQILPRVITFAALEGSDVTLLHILSPQLFAPPTEVAAINPAEFDEDFTVAQDYLLRIGKELRRHGIAVRTDIVVSENIAEAIADFAGREQADMIAIATHGRGGVARMLRGSVADAVMHRAKKSMLVLKPEKIAQEEAPSVSGAVAESLAV